jgi:hypothetical protein
MLQLRRQSVQSRLPGPETPALTLATDASAASLEPITEQSPYPDPRHIALPVQPAAAAAKHELHRSAYAANDWRYPSEWISARELEEINVREVAFRLERNAAMQPYRSTDEYEAAGHTALGEALRAKRMSGSTTPEVVAAFETARTYYVGAISMIHTLPDVRAADVYFSYAFCLESIARAPVMEAYREPRSIALGLDRRADFHEIARQTYRRAEEIKAHLAGQTTNSLVEQSH